MTVTFSEAVTLAGGTLNVTLDTGDVIAIAAFGPSLTATGTYTVGTGDTSLDLDATAIALSGGATLRDAATNNTVVTLPATTIADGSAIVIDTTAPNLTLATVTPNPTNGLIAVTVEFSEDVTGFAIGDIDVTGGGAQDFVVTDGNSYTFNVSPTPGPAQTVTIRVLADKAADPAGNGNTISNILTHQSDTVAPTLLLATVTPNPTNGLIAVTATFSESVTGFVIGDIDVTGGTAQNFAGSGASYTFNVSPTPGPAQSVTVQVLANKAADAATNGNTISNLLSHTSDTVAPTIDSITSTTLNGYYNVPDAINVTVTFSEAVTLAGGTLNVTLDTGDVIAISAFGPSLTATGTYTVGTGDTSLDLDSTVIALSGGATLRDAATNNTVVTLPATTIADGSAIVVDTTAPTVVLATVTPDPTNGLISVTAEFSEDVTGFVISDISLTGGVVQNFAGSLSSYSFDIDPNNGNSVLVSIRIPASMAIDAAGNGNVISNLLTHTSDTVAPTVLLATETPNPTNGLIAVTAEFSENVIGFAIGDIDVTGGLAQDYVSLDGNSYTFNVDPTNSPAQTVTVEIPAGSAFDTVGYGNDISNTLTHTSDTVAPTIDSITSVTADGLYNEPDMINVTVTFSEAVTLAGGTLNVTLSTGDIVAIGAFGPSLTATGTYTVGASDTSSDLDSTGIVLSGGTLRDAATNSVVVALPATTIADGSAIVIDTTSPTVALGSVTSNPTNGFIAVTAEFSENMTGFDVGDITVTGGVARDFVVIDGNSYTFNVDPIDGQSQAVTIQVLADKAIDPAGNGNTASNTLSYTSDTVVPSVVLTSGTPNPTNDLILVTAQFSEAVTGFSFSDISVTNGDVGNFTPIDTDTYTFEVDPTNGASVTVTIQIPADRVVDLVGYGNTASNQLVYTAPVITIVNPTSAPALTKTITASTNSGTLTKSDNAGATCDDSLTFVTYAATTFSTEADNGKTVCYMAEDIAGNVTFALSAPIAGIDRTGPIAPVFALLDPINNVNRTQVTIYGVGEAFANIAWSINDTDDATAAITGTSSVSAGGLIAITGINVATLSYGVLTATLTLTDPLTNVGVSGTDTASYYPYEGRNIKAIGPAVYFIQGGQKHIYNSELIFLSHGYSWSNISTVTNVVLANFTTGEPVAYNVNYRNGHLLKASAPDVYYIEGGQKRLIRSWELFQILGFRAEDVINTTDVELSYLPTGENMVYTPRANGILIRGSDPTVYLLDGGEKRPIESAEIFFSRGYSFGSVVYVHDLELPLYPTGPAVTYNVHYRDGQVIKGSGPDVYLVDNGVKQAFLTWYQFLDWGSVLHFAPADIRPVSDLELSYIPTGAAMDFRPRAEGAILKGSAPEVYILSSDQLHRFPSGEVYLSQGHTWSQIVEISDLELIRYAVGAPVSYNVHFRDGHVIQGSGPDIFYVDDGAKSVYLTWSQFLAWGTVLGYTPASIVSVSDLELSLIPAGPDMEFFPFAEGTILKGSGPDVYILQNDELHRFPTAEIFVSHGYLWPEIIEISDIELMRYAIGEPVV